MTALTWQQARRFIECDCQHSNRAQCAVISGRGSQYCPCECHGYVCAPTDHEQETTEHAE